MYKSTREKKCRKKVKFDDNTNLVMMTWIRRDFNVRNASKSLIDLVSQSESFLAPGITYCCCEAFDNYFNGGLYPVLHWNTDKKLLKELISTEDFIPTNQLGDRHMVEQAIYREEASVCPSGERLGNYSVLSVAAFRRIEDESAASSAVLLREWKSWTGARGFMVDLFQSGLSCHEIKFYVKEAPLDTTDTFHYVVTTEVGISEPNDEGLFVDVMQRFRVERWLGYRTIYRKYQSNDN